MYTEDSQLHVVKGLMTFTEFLDAYEPHKEKDCVLHFRIRTHGDTDQENTHPFLIDKDLGLVHNGILNNIDTKTDLTKSDTWHFSQLHLAEFRLDNPKFFLNPVYKTILESFIGFSKLIFMDNEGNVEIFNENKGTWNSDCWFSNSSYQTPSHNVVQYKKHTRFQSEHQKQLNLTRLQAGDICKLLDIIGFGEKTIPKDSYVKVLYFNQWGSMQVEELLTGVQGLADIEDVEKIGTKKETTFAVDDVVKFTRNFNHFRTGTTTKILGVIDTTRKAMIASGYSRTIYWIPFDYLEKLPEEPELLVCQADDWQDSYSLGNYCD